MEFLKELKASLDASKSVLPDEVLLDSYEMGKLLKCSTSTLRRYRNNGSVPCSKVGRRYYYPKNFFTQEFLNSITKRDDPSKRFDDL
jgi:hypothetical protein